MEVKAIQKFILQSPRKIRPLVDEIKGLDPVRVLQILPLVKKRAAEPLIKAIASALANAKAKGMKETELAFKEIQVNEGPRLKRGRPVSRGRWHPIKRRMSHIRIVLETKTLPSEKLKVQSVKPKETLDVRGVGSRK